MKKSFFALMAGFALGISSMFFMSSCMADDELEEVESTKELQRFEESSTLYWYYEKSEALLSEVIKYDPGFWDGVGSGEEYAEYLAAKKAVENFYEDFRK